MRVVVVDHDVRVKFLLIVVILYLFLSLSNFPFHSSQSVVPLIVPPDSLQLVPLLKAPVLVSPGTVGI